VARHIFQACPVWIQSNITNIIFTWVHNTNTENIILLIYIFSGSCIPINESLFILLALYLHWQRQFGVSMGYNHSG
jgi:hypothetical protein